MSEVPIFAPADCSLFFAGFSNLISIDFNNNFNTSNVANMQYMFLFSTSLATLDLSSFNTSNVTNMRSIFNKCSSLTSINLNSFNTLNLTDMCAMFYNCTGLTKLDLSNFNTSKVTNMIGMFGNCLSLITTINIMSIGITDYTFIFTGAETKEGAKITVNYIADAATLVDNMLATKSSNSNVVKENQL